MGPADRPRAPFPTPTALRLLEGTWPQLSHRLDEGESSKRSSLPHPDAN